MARLWTGNPRKTWRNERLQSSEKLGKAGFPRLFGKPSQLFLGFPNSPQTRHNECQTHDRVPVDWRARRERVIDDVVFWFYGSYKPLKVIRASDRSPTSLAVGGLILRGISAELRQLTKHITGTITEKFNFCRQIERSIPS